MEIRTNSMIADYIERVIKYQVETLRDRGAGAHGAQTVFEFLRTEAASYGYAVEETTFPLQAMRIGTLEHSIGQQPFYALPYFGCPPFLPFCQSADMEAPLATGRNGCNAPHGHVILANIEDGEVGEQILALKEAGYRGVIFVSRQETDRELLGLFAPIASPRSEDISQIRDFTVTCVSRETGEMLYERSRQGICLKQSIKVSAYPATARNLFVRPARAKRPRVRVITHYDRAFEAPDLPCASDNASGVAVLAAVMKACADGKGCPPDIEFVFYDAEEYLLYGGLSLMVDLEAELKKRSWRDFYDVVAFKRGDTLRTKKQPDHVIEIDTVGYGRVLHYGTTELDEVFAHLRSHNLGGEFNEIKLSRQNGNLTYIGDQAGIPAVSVHHFLTLGAEGRAHTLKDDWSSLDLGDVAAFAAFLQRLVLSL